MILVYLLSLNVSIFLIGLMITTAFGLRNRWEILGSSYLIGSGLITLLFLLLHHFGRLNLDLLNLLLSALLSVGLGALSLSFSGKRVNLNIFNVKEDYFRIKNMEYPQKAMVMLLILIVCYSLWDNFIWPITSWDSLAIYDFRSRVILDTGSMTRGIELGYFFQYPPYTSFLHLFGYFLNLKQVKVLYSFIFASLLMSFYGLMRRSRGMLISQLALLFLATDAIIFRHATMAYTNLPYISFIAIGLIFLNYWVEKGYRSDLLIGLVLSGFSTWVRPSEPFWMISIGIAVLGLFIHRRHYISTLLGITFVITISKYWNYYTESLFRENGVQIQSLSERQAQIISGLMTNLSQTFMVLKVNLPEAITYFSTNLFIILGSLIPLFIIGVVSDIQKKNKQSLTLYLTLLLSLGIVFAGVIYLSLFYETWNQIADSLQRVLMTLIPLILFTAFRSKVFDDLEK